MPQETLLKSVWERLFWENYCGPAWTEGVFQVRWWSVCSQVHSPTFWVNLALLCNPDWSAAQQINRANELDRNQILASVMIQFPKVLVLSVIWRLQVFRTKQVDEYDISVKPSVPAPCCLVAVTDMHFCHKKSYRNRQVMLTRQYVYFVGEDNSAKNMILLFL